MKKFMLYLLTVLTVLNAAGIAGKTFEVGADRSQLTDNRRENLRGGR